MAARGRKARLASTFGPASAHSWFVAPGRSVACGSAPPGTANKLRRTDFGRGGQRHRVPVRGRARMILRVRLAQDPDIPQERRADRRSRPERLEQKDRVYAFFRK